MACRTMRAGQRAGGDEAEEAKEAEEADEVDEAQPAPSSMSVAGPGRSRRRCVGPWRSGTAGVASPAVDFGSPTATT